jgi:hypothetical protein
MISNSSKTNDFSRRSLTSENKANSVKEVLIAAKYLLENIGWCQGHFSLHQDGKPVSFCMLGAINAVEVWDIELTWEAKILLSQTIFKNISDSQMLSDWNDKPARKKRDVIKLFDKSIRKLDKEKSL